MKHASLFTGIGGFDLAAQWMGWENVFQVEIDGFCQKVLEKNFPNVKRYGDIKQFDGREWAGKIDILSGGFPCQSFSLAGKGAVDLSLWKEMFRIVGQARPKVIVAENVYGILARKKGMALSTVYDDLESEAYTTMPPFIIPACAVNAPHRRDRVWIIAYSNEWSGSKHGLCAGRNVSEEWASEVITNNNNNKGLQRSEVYRSAGEVRQESWQLTAGLFQSEWENFPTQSPLCGGDDVLSNRVDSIKSLGNAVVPKLVLEIFRAIEQVNK